MNLSRKIVYNGIATTVYTLSGLVRNKIFAVFLSINLFGILSIGQQSMSLLFTVFAFGLPLGISTLISQSTSLSKAEQSLRTTQVIILTLFVALSISIVLIIILMFDAESISVLITGSGNYVTPITIILFSVPFMVIEYCLFSVMEGMGLVRKIVLFRLIPSIVILPILYFLSSQYGLIGSSYGILINEVLLSIVGLILLSEFVNLSKQSFQISDTLVKIFKIALLSFAVGVSWLITDFLIKRYALIQTGEIANGIIQSIAKVTDLYPNIALAWLTMHLFPSLGGKKEDKSFIAVTIERTITISLAIIIPMVIFLFAFRPQILSIIYKKEFELATFYFGAMLLTGIPKVFSWVLGISLLPIGMKRQWFYSSMLYTLVFGVIAFAGLHSSLSFYAIPLALGLSLTLQAGFGLYIFKKSSIKFSKKFVEQLLYYIAITICLMAGLYNEVFIFPAILIYIIFGMRSKLFQEVFDKALDILSHITKKNNSTTI